MKNQIKILSPGDGCGRTRKIIRYLESFMAEKHIEATFTIETDPEEFIKYPTWLLPTIIINGKIAARGYKPDEHQILKNIKT